MELNTGLYGAKRQTLNEANPRSLLRKLFEKNPFKSQTQLCEEMWETLLDEDNRDTLKTTFIYWFTNNYRSILTEHQQTPEEKAIAYGRRKRESDLRRAKKAKLVEKVRVQANKIINERAKICLLEMLMPNGKLFRDCTGAECRELSTVLGAWIGRVAEKVAPKQKVGSVCTEEDLQELYVR